MSILPPNWILFGKSFRHNSFCFRFFVSLLIVSFQIFRFAIASSSSHLIRTLVDSVPIVMVIIWMFFELYINFTLLWINILDIGVQEMFASIMRHNICQLPKNLVSENFLEILLRFVQKYKPYWWRFLMSKRRCVF